MISKHYKYKMMTLSVMIDISMIPNNEMKQD